MQMRGQAIPQLARVRRQVQHDLAHVVDHLATRALVAGELARREALALPHAAQDRPQQQVRHVNGHRWGQGREARCVRPDCAGVAAGVEGDDLELVDFLVSVLAW